jgi:hypothetical protein
MGCKHTSEFAGVSNQPLQCDEKRQMISLIHAGAGNCWLDCWDGLRLRKFSCKEALVYLLAVFCGGGGRIHLQFQIGHRCRFPDIFLDHQAPKESREMRGFRGASFALFLLEPNYAAQSRRCSREFVRLTRTVSQRLH